MKKAIFTALVVLLALLAVTCDNALMSQKLSSEALPAAGPDFVTVGINISAGRSRALDKTQAQSIVEAAGGFYEVVFVKGGAPAITVRDNTERTGFSTWKVTVPKASYTDTNTGADKAVLFVGRDSDKTLLAIGTLASPGADFTVVPPPASVTFELTTITSALDATPANSAFNITHADAPPGKYIVKVLSGPADGGAVSNALVHQIPKGLSGVAGTYTFKGLTAGVVSIVNAEARFKPASIDDGVSITTGVTSAAVSGTTLTVQTTLNTPNAPGYAKISVEVPVFAISTDKSPDYGKNEAIKWYIRGGLDNAKVDTGDPDLTTNDGGAVFIHLYNPDVIEGVEVGTEPTWG